jgi:excisionase family DNA binding protein
MSSSTQEVSRPKRPMWVRLLDDMDTECATVSIATAAKVLGISRAGTYELARKGTLPTIRVGGRWLVPKAAFKKLLEPA